jgi:cell wall-associated NlpC family hydrolase
MVDGIHQCRPGSHRRSLSGAARLPWDSHECPGPSTEAALSRPSTRRALTAGAIALVVIAPTVEIAEHPAEAGSPPSTATSATYRTPSFDPVVTLGQRLPRVSRSAARRPSATRRAGVRPAVTAVRAARQAARREGTRIAAARRAAESRRAVAVRAAARRAVAERGSVRADAGHGSVRRVTAQRAKPRRSTAVKRVRGASRRMAAVLAYARAQIGKRYASGGEGPHSFDCSGFTKRAYAQVGIRLPHSSSGQAARARTISRAQARPGDLVVGPGHVGVYMGAGMMIDAGNPRTGVVYRRLYGGLHLERF